MSAPRCCWWATSTLSAGSGFGFTQGVDKPVDNFVDKPVDNFVFRFRQGDSIYASNFYGGGKG